MDKRLVVKLWTEKGEVTGFVIHLYWIENAEAWLRGKEKAKGHSVYRCDTAHGYLHEQKFWISPEPKEVNVVDLSRTFERKLDQVRERADQYVRLYKEKKLDDS